jgi:hypothetical protein
MRKSGVLFTIFVYCAFSLNAQQTEKITYKTEDGRTHTKTAIYFGLQETRMYISGQYGDSWIRSQDAVKEADTNAKWSDWEDGLQFPVPYASNRDLTSLVEEILSHATEQEFRGVLMVRIPAKNRGVDYWWENQRYICFFRRVYLVMN